MANAAFTALTTDVYALTKRADLTAETDFAVRAATLKLHQMDFYPKDMYESKVNFTVADYFQTINYRTLYPRFRSLAYLRKWESNAATEFLKLLSPDNVLDSYGVAKENVAYMAGDVIQVRSNTQITDVLIGMYLNPITDPDSYVSWIATQHPQAIVAEATATILRTIGWVEEANSYRQLANEYAMEVQNFNILAGA